MKTQKGFTLIELLVVISIIGLLSTLAVVAINSARRKEKIDPDTRLCMSFNNQTAEYCYKHSETLKTNKL